MILQDFVASGLEEKLLYHRCGMIDIAENMIRFSKDSILCTDTYINSFSIEKWKKYTSISGVSLVIRGKGVFQITIYNSYLLDEKEHKDIINTDMHDFYKDDEYKFDLSKITKGIVHLEILSIGEDGIINCISYCVEPVNIKPVKIALNICTYKREKELLRNIDILRENILNNKSSVLYQNLEVYITDNGSTLALSDFSNEHIHIVQNPNVGGAGGFSRGLIEISRKKKERNITHIIFMDDDVKILSESLIRTYRLLTLLKEEYSEHFIAGAMLRLDKESIQHENGAIWNQGKCKFLNRGLDLSIFNNVIRNEDITSADYAAWWYCCVPQKFVNINNLALPLFIHEDDVEYSLRNAKGIITMNGIAVWHPVAENKRVSSNQYYNLRNKIIVNTRFCPIYSKKQVKKNIRTELVMCLLRYRYLDMKLTYYALEDFCKGPEWLYNLDAVEHHKMIQNSGYIFKNMHDVMCNYEDGLCGNLNIQDGVKKWYREEKSRGHGFSFIIKLCTLNGWIVPPKSGKYRFTMSVHPFDMYRCKRVMLYDDISEQGIELKRDVLKIFYFIYLYVKAVCLIDRKFSKAQVQYKEWFSRLQDYDYWAKQLKLMS